ncbi:MAG: kinesin-like protein Klp8 [Pycnora praestabilis]|nr:MAG: kinesin-like protein Klp8 [Pycnora praestabilis]
MAQAGGGNIKVVVRVRPLNGRELNRGAKCVVEMKEGQTILTPPSDLEDRHCGSAKGTSRVESPKVFAFDQSYWSLNHHDPQYAGQNALFADLGRPLLDNAFQGYNNCIFAYGQTGSGKSYSMMGYGAEAGVIPRICQDMFERITELQKDHNLTCTVEVSYLEIYNERVRDLLNPATKGNLKVREHPSTGPYVEDLAKLVVRSFQEIANLMDEGNKARTVAATNMNETSSRSHAVFTLTLTQRRHDVETRIDTEKVAKISLVDLAGSERATSTGATGARLKEGAEINRSLSTLGRVISALADFSVSKKRNTSMVPYRDSVLTWLLKDSLGGNSMTAMIAAISPADINYEETLSTLRYADSAKRIKNHAVVNEDPNARMIRELKEELAQLRSKLSGGVTAGGTAEEQHAPDTPLEKQIVSITQADGTTKQVSKAEIAEQLNQSEKLYQDLNQTWEQKLQKTEQIHKEREAALEELGISVEKGFVGVSTPKKVPHLVNLSDDPLLAECLVYNIKPGTTTVGNVDTATTSEIRLNGAKILQEHCTFENNDNIVTIIPKVGADVMVNGERIDIAKRLRSGYRIILGDFHIFRFNHPQEARKERAEQSLLRHSITASQVGSPIARPQPHQRTCCTAESDFDGDISRPATPMSTQRNSRDSDWSFARREAAHAISGLDQKMAHLTDNELDNPYEYVQKLRALRKGRPESRLDCEDDLDSVTSNPIRGKYASSGTMDNSSLDTAITIPPSPQSAEVDENSHLVREDIQGQLEKQKQEYQDRLHAAEAANVQIEDIRAEKQRMQESLRVANEEMQIQLVQQKRDFEVQLEHITVMPQRGMNAERAVKLGDGDIAKAIWAVKRWRKRRYVHLAENILQHAAIMKEAQVMSQELDKNVVFQFAIIDIGHTLASSYDLVLNGISGEDDDYLDAAFKPCVGARVVDYRHNVIHLWSLEKLQKRIRLMRQMHQYIDRPEYLQHFSLENPFSESCLPQYSLLGDADIPLATVFEAKVQDFTLDVLSPYTLSVVGVVKLSLEPSSAQAPSSTLKFNVVMHDFSGFAEREGTEVHAQLFIPGVSEEGGATTTQMIAEFDEGPVRFESVHSMSLPRSSSHDSTLRMAIFARITAMHLDKLLSWDNMKDAVPQPRKKRKNARLAEREFYLEERYDVFARVQILEMLETGEYLPVEVVQHNDLDSGAYQLHHGLQRRVVVNLTHDSSDRLRWGEVLSLWIGCVRLVDLSGHVPDMNSMSAKILLNLVSQPAVRNNANGTSNVTLVGQWDSSRHESLLLDRATPEKYRVQMSLFWDMTCGHGQQTLNFSMDMSLQSTRIVRSSVGLFTVIVRPASAKRAVDLWRMNTKYDYVKGEEYLTGWAPRGISLVRDFMDARKRKQRAVEVESVRGNLARPALAPLIKHAKPESLQPPERLEQVLKKFVNLWSSQRDPANNILSKQNTEPPANGAASAAEREDNIGPQILVPEVQHIMKNPSILKAGYLLSLDENNTRWVKRFVELRRPYLHIHIVPTGDEVHAVSLQNSRIDHQPHVANLLQRPNVFAVYAPHNTYLFAARNEREKIEWILKIDQSYFSSESNSGDDS